MDTRAARRAAEKAARDLITSRAALIGELGVAQAERGQLEHDVTAAGEHGHKLVAAAQAEAARLLETARAAVRDAEQRYTAVYGAATAAGWAAADLTALGFQPHPTGARSRRTATPAQRTERDTPASQPDPASAASQ